MTVKHVVVDGSNLATEGRTLPSLQQLDEAVRAMTFRDGELWMATASGIHRLAGPSVQDRCPARDRGIPGDPIRIVNTLVADRLGGLWLGTDSGLLYLPKGGACDGGGGDFLSFTVENSPLPNNRVTSATLNPGDGSVWFGTPEGLSVWTRSCCKGRILRLISSSSTRILCFPPARRAGDAVPYSASSAAGYGSKSSRAMKRRGPAFMTWPVIMWEISKSPR